MFRSGSESPSFPMIQLPVFEETKQRRATVSGGEKSYLFIIKFTHSHLQRYASHKQ